MDKILKQTSLFFLAQILTRVVSFFYTLYLARNLGVVEFGSFSASLAYFSLASAIADFGFNRILTLRIATNKDRLAELVWNVSLLRLTLSSVLFALVAVFLYIVDPDKNRVNLSLLAVMAVIPLSLSQTFDAVFVAVRKLGVSAITLIVLSLSTAFFGIYFIGLFGVVGAAVALILGQLIYFLLLLFFLIKQEGLIFSTVRGSILKEIISQSLPYGLLAILGMIYFKVDTLLLTYMKGNYDAGIYTAGYKFLESVIFIPSALSLALFPVMAKLHGGSKKELRKIYFQSIRFIGLMSLVVVVSYILILPQLIERLLPNYLPSIEIIKILSLAIPFMFIHAPGVQLLLSTSKYLKSVVILSFVTLGFNIILNLVFIPTHGFLAASWITVFSEILSFLVFFTLIMKKVL